MRLIFIATQVLTGTMLMFMATSLVLGPVQDHKVRYEALGQ